MSNKTIWNFFKGTATKKQHGIIIFLVLLVLAIMWLTAQALFNGHYSPLNNTISNQGRTDYNPRGFFFFTIGCATAGFFLIFHFLFLYRNYSPTLIWILRLFMISGIVGGIAFMCVGFVPGNLNKPVHGFFAELAFGSFYVSAFSLLIVMLRKLQLKESWPTPKRVIGIYTLFIVLLLLVIIMPNLDSLATVWNVDPRLFDWPIWQWTAFFNILIWLVLVYLIIPKQNSE